MRTLPAVVTVAVVSACGASSPPPTSPPPVPPAASAAAASSDAGLGPPSTTTQTVGTGAGTKLTPLGSADAGAAVGTKKHGELGRTTTDLRAIVNAHRDEARACYDAAVAGNPSLEGTIDIRFTIDPSGKVTDVTIDPVKSDLTDPALGNCIAGVLKKIQFNASPGGYETKANYPFNFHPHTHHQVNP